MISSHILTVYLASYAIFMGIDILSWLDFGSVAYVAQLRLRQEICLLEFAIFCRYVVGGLRGLNTFF